MWYFFQVLEEKLVPFYKFKESFNQQTFNKKLVYRKAIFEALQVIVNLFESLQSDKDINN